MISVKQHLKDSQMSYWYHFKHSLRNGLGLQWLAITSIVHAIFPQIWAQHSARGVIKMYNRMKQFAHLRKLQKNLKDF